MLLQHTVFLKQDSLGYVSELKEPTALKPRVQGATFFLSYSEMQESLQLQQKLKHQANLERLDL